MNQIREPIVSDFSLLEANSLLSSNSDLVCLSYLQWDAVHQRSQHVLSSWAQHRRVFFVEEPVLEPITSWWSEVSERECGVWVVVPHLPNWVSDGLRAAMHQSLMDELFEQYAIANPILWHHTATALSSNNHLSSSAIHDRLNH